MKESRCSEEGGPHRPGVVKEGVSEEVGPQPGRKFVSSASILPVETSKQRQSQKDTNLRGSPESRLVAMNLGETVRDKRMSRGHQNRAFLGTK